MAVTPLPLVHQVKETYATGNTRTNTDHNLRYCHPPPVAGVFSAKSINFCPRRATVSCPIKTPSSQANGRKYIITVHYSDISRPPLITVRPSVIYLLLHTLIRIPSTLPPPKPFLYKDVYPPLPRKQITNQGLETKRNQGITMSASKVLRASTTGRTPLIQFLGKRSIPGTCCTKIPHACRVLVDAE